MAEEVSRDKILFVGTETDQTLSILRQIVGANANPTEVSFATHVFKTFPLHIDNKYYTAKLEVIHIHKNIGDCIGDHWDLVAVCMEDPFLDHCTITLTIDLQYNLNSISSYCRFDTISDLTEVREQLGEVCEALVIAVDATKKENLEVIKGWGSFVEEYSPSVNLCVAHTAGSIGHKEMEAWCMDNGVEFVLPAEGNQEEQQGPFQEKFGADRVIEALQANMWPNMEYKTEKRPTAVITEDDDEHQHQSESKVEDQPQEKPKEKLTKAQRKEKAIQREKEEQSLREAEAKHKQLQEQRSRIEKKKNKGKKLTAEDLLRLSAVEENDEELEEKMEDDLKNFERALQDMSLLRNKAQSMPDDQRREFAAKMAMQLLSGFGLDDDENDLD